MGSRSSPTNYGDLDDILRPVLLRQGHNDLDIESKLEGFHPEIPCTSADQPWKRRLYVVEQLQSAIVARPHCPLLRLQLAAAYDALAYPELAAAEAYNALLLLDEVTDDCGEWHDEAIETLRQTLRDHDAAIAELDDDDELMAWAGERVLQMAYSALAIALAETGCLRTAAVFLRSALRVHPLSPALLAARHVLHRRVRRHIASTSTSSSPNHGLPNDETAVLSQIDDYPNRGRARRELYPWNRFEPDRTSPAALAELDAWVKEVAPSLEVRATELPVLFNASANDADRSAPKTITQLGLFATTPLSPNTAILREPSTLTAHARLHDAYCDACATSLSPTASSTTVPCPDCDTAVFCTPSCRAAAMHAYHPAECGAPPTATAGGDPDADPADDLYARLLLRALSMAAHRDTPLLAQRELRYLWGDLAPPARRIGRGRVQAAWAASLHDASSDADADPDSDADEPEQGWPDTRTLPFTFHACIHLPHTHLLTALAQPPWHPCLGAPWAWLTTLAKLRGVASARPGPPGTSSSGPAVAAVHPRWCLANHSCDPNVGWEWGDDDDESGSAPATSDAEEAMVGGSGGAVRFWVRERRVAWRGREAETGGREGGIGVGEEVRSHYCDVDLPVGERREWAAGALGGRCGCERCVWEEGVERQTGADGS